MKVQPSGVAREPAPSLGREERPIVALVERDPYLAFLIRLHVPEATVIEPEADATVAEIAAMNADLVIAGIEGSPFPLSDLLTGPQRQRVLVVVDGARAGRSAIPSTVDGVLVRPFAPADLMKAVRGALGLGPPDEDPRTVGPALARARSWLAPARVAGVAVAAVIDVAGRDASGPRAYILAIAFVYATLRWLLPRLSIVADAADVAVATILVAATDGLSSPYTLFAAVVTVGGGLARGPRFGVLGGLAVVAGSIPIAVLDLRSGFASVREAVAWGLLFPLLGVTGGFASRVWRSPSAEGLNVLIEANRVLSSLYRIARTLPGGLEIGSVAEATMHEIRDALGSRAGAMLLADAGTTTVVGSFGLNEPSEVLVRDQSQGLGAAFHGDARVLKRGELHPATAQALGEFDCWLVAQLQRDGIPQGLLIAACPDEAAHDRNISLLRRLADEAAVAVENARLFSRVREISIDEERRRLARELHDGIAQSLTHLRYELDFIARHGANVSDSIRKDMTRLSRVVERTTADVRSMILGLRASVADQGLVGALRSYLADLQRLGGPDIVFDARGEVRLPGDIEGEIFRVAQEAVSNALRHASARTISVRLTSGATQIRLAVEDDGVGLRSKRSKTGGIGLDAMRERAELIGAHFEVAERDGGGTVVRLEYTIQGDGQGRSA